MKEIISVIGFFITGLCTGAWLMAMYIVYRMRKYGRFHYDGKDYVVKEKGE